jgi:hypothetical protein
LQPKLSTAAKFTMLAILTAPFAKPGAVYNFTSFDGPGPNGGGTTVNGINNNGALVGFTSDNAANPTLLTNFVRNADGTFTTLNINNDPLAMANGLNDSSLVVGASNSNGFSQAGSQFTALAPVVPGDTGMETAFGVNDHGVIVGQFTRNSTDTQPGFVDNGSSFTILSPTANATVVNAQSINNQGLVVGLFQRWRPPARVSVQRCHEKLSAYAGPGRRQLGTDAVSGN